MACGAAVNARGAASYSDLAIETGLMLGWHFTCRCAQTEGLMASIFELLEVALSVPDHSTLSRRAMKLTSISKGCRLPEGRSNFADRQHGAESLRRRRMAAGKAWRESAAHLEKAASCGGRRLREPSWPRS